MKLNYEELQSKSRILQSLTSLKPQEFEILLANFGSAWKRVVAETFQGEDRKRSYGASRKPQLQKLADKYRKTCRSGKKTAHTVRSNVILWTPSIVQLTHRQARGDEH